MAVLAASPSADSNLCSSIHDNLAKIVHLHNEILTDLRRIFPDQGHFRETISEIPYGSPTLQSKRLWNLDVVPETKTQGQQPNEDSHLTAEPQTAADVATLFAKMVRCGFINDLRF